MITLLSHFDLRPRNTMRIPAIARRWLEFSSRSDIPAVAEALAEIPSLPHIVIGEGSNILFTEAEYPGTVVHSSILDLEISPVGNGRVMVKAGSGLNMDALAERTASAGLWGMENLSLIPGEVGASAVQNVGAYGCEASDIISEVEAYDLRERRFVCLSPAECRFAYRHSLFKTPEGRGRYIISSVAFALSSSPNPRLGYGNLAAAVESSGEPLTPMAVRRAVIATRQAKLPDPALVGSAGSYFTNPIISASDAEAFKARARALVGPDVRIPAFELEDGRVKLSAAWLIDRAGIKGTRIGGAGVWPSQPLVIVNESGSATAADIIALEHHIIDRVLTVFGITLTPEVEKA